MGGVTAPVSFAGLVAPGLYQINVTVPMADMQYRFFGVPVSASFPGVATQACGYIQYDWFDVLGSFPDGITPRDKPTKQRKDRMQL
jgi:hypothetical protein